MCDFKVIIIGAGLSGSLLANGLTKHNIEYCVYERDSSNTKRDGYQIRIGEHALIGMRACLDRSSLSQVIENIGTNVKVPILYDKKFDKFFDLNKLPTYSKSVPIDRVVLRDIFVKPIAQLGRIRYDKKFTGFRILEDGHDQVVQVLFDDGSTDRCNLLIGADGNRSKLNEFLGLKNIKPLKGWTAFLTKCDLPLSVYKQVNQDILKSPIVTLQDGKLMYFCAYLPKAVPESLESIDQPKMAGESSSCMLSLCWPSDLTPAFDDMNLDQRWTAVMEIFKDWSSNHQQVFQLCRGKDMFLLSPRVGMDPSVEWRRKIDTSANLALGNPHVWLMGDAIHPMIPNRGQGGQQAMHDTADALPAILELVKKASLPQGLEEKDFKAACYQYEKAMIPRAFRWVQKSGGDNYVPFDLSKVVQRIGFKAVSSIVVPAAWLWYWATCWLGTTSLSSDAPEFG